MSSKIASSCSLVIVLLASSAQATPRPVTHVACVGDSITQGNGASQPSASYPSQLQGLMGNSVQVENFGRSGATLLTVGDMPYNEQSEYTAATNFVDNLGPDAVVSVVIMLGANDSKPQNWDSAGRPEQYLTDYLALVDHFLGLSSQPTVYVALPTATGTDPCCQIRGDVIHDEVLPLLQQVAEERRLPIIDLNTPTTGHPEYFGDGVHPTDSGYSVLAELMKVGLEREPTASIEMPAMDASLPAGLIPISVAVSGDTVDIASVEFFDGETSLGTETAPPFEFAWQASAGSHSLAIKAVDTTLADVTSEAHSVTVTAAEDASAAGGAANGGAANGGTGGMVSGGAGGALGDNAGAQGGAAGSQGTTGGQGGVEGAVSEEPSAGAPVENTPVETPGPQPDTQDPPVDNPGTAPAATPEPAAGATSPAASASAQPNPSAPAKDGGCASVPRTAGQRSGAWMMLGLILVTLRRRRRHPSAHSRSGDFRDLART